MDAQTVADNIQEIASEFAKEPGERQLRRDLRRAGFDKTRDSGYLLTAVPVNEGGIFESVARSTRPICDMLRTLAHGDPSIALVSAMHPAVISFGGWLSLPEAPEPYREAWENSGDGYSKPPWMVASGGLSCPNRAVVATPERL